MTHACLPGRFGAPAPFMLVPPPGDVGSVLWEDLRALEAVQWPVAPGRPSTHP